MKTVPKCSDVWPSDSEDSIDPDSVIREDVLAKSSTDQRIVHLYELIDVIEKGYTSNAYFQREKEMLVSLIEIQKNKVNCLESKICSLNATANMNSALLTKFQEFKNDRSLLEQKDRIIKSLEQTIKAKDRNWNWIRKMDELKTKMIEDLQVANELKDQTIKELRTKHQSANTVQKEPN